MRWVPPSLPTAQNASATASVCTASGRREGPSREGAGPITTGQGLPQALGLGRLGGVRNTRTGKATRFGNFSPSFLEGVWSQHSWEAVSVEVFIFSKKKKKPYKE